MSAVAGKRVLIYGAGGYTGRLIATHARARGLDIVVAGRRRAPLEPLAATLGLPWRVAAAQDRDALTAAFADAALVINCASPFELTAKPVLAACLHVGADYLDVAGEWPVIADLSRCGADAERRGVMVMPGAGFVYAASDALAAHVARLLPEPRMLRLGFSRGDRISRGSFVSMLGLAGDGALVRRDGALRRAPLGRLEHAFDYGEGPRLSLALPWPDAVAAFHTTGIANIEAYLEAPDWMRWLAAPASMLAGAIHASPARGFVERLAAFLPDGPSEVEREATPKTIVAEVEDLWRRLARARLTTPNVYTFTQSCIVAIAERALGGERRPGFRTPAEVYGPDFVLALPGVQRTDMTDPAAG